MPIRLVHCLVRINGHIVLNELSVDIRAGHMIAIMGVSGAGKTTMLRVIGGELQPISGSVERPQPLDLVAWIPQSAPVLPRRSALDNVALGAYARGFSAARALAVASGALRDVGIASFSSRQVKTLSGGERQRVAVARALAMGSSLILADEPTSSLDAANRDAVVMALRVVCSHGGTVLVATHDDAVASQCDGVIRLEDGKVREKQGPDVLS